MIACAARVKGTNMYIQQHLTDTRCRYSNRHCQPREMHKSKIVWHRMKHDTRLYHSLGQYKAQELDNYILVPSISVSGTIISTREKSTVLYRLYPSSTGPAKRYPSSS